MPRSASTHFAPRAAAFWILALLFLMLFFASAAASPLYPVYQVQFHFSATTLTAVFAVYVLVLLVALLLFGSLSDYLGRLPVIITALVVSAGGCYVFVAAHGVGGLYVGRALQGIATALGSGAIGAALIDLQPAGSKRAPVVTSAFSSLGLALGALITSLIVQYGPEPTHLIWWVLLVAFVLGIVAVLFMAEPGSTRPGVLNSLRPRVAVPRQARGAFVGAIPVFIAGWALGGLYLSLGPSLAAQAAGSSNRLWGGVVIFLLAGTGAAAVFVCRGVDSRTAMLSGCLFLLVGMAVTFVAIATTTVAALLAGTTIAGVGFGLAFLGAFRRTTALAAPDESAGLLAAIFIVAYPRVQRSRPDRRGSDDALRSAADRPRLLGRPGRRGRDRGRHAGVAHRRRAGPSRRGRAGPGPAGPVHRSAVRAGHASGPRLTSDTARWPLREERPPGRDLKACGDLSARSVRSGWSW